MVMSPMMMRAAVKSPQEAIASWFKIHRNVEFKAPAKMPLSTFKITEPPSPAREMSQSEEPFLPCRIK